MLQHGFSTWPHSTSVYGTSQYYSLAKEVTDVDAPLYPIQELSTLLSYHSRSHWPMELEVGSGNLI